MAEQKKHVGIGFATGRISFQNVLRAYIFHLQESQFLVRNDMLLSLYVAYDPSYNQTTRADYDNLTEEEKSMFLHCRFIGPEDIRAEARRLVDSQIIEEGQADQCFGNGYAVQRNIIQYTAIRDHVDYLIFLDDDEYPLAVTESHTSALWSGQSVLEEHIRYLQFSDYTNGYHCGYLSPLPSIEFDGILEESIFHQFTDGLSSDVLRWDTVSETLQSGGVTYADKKVLMEHKAKLVMPDCGARFISGGNLGINLTRPERVLPFYNPPGGRGEDSILSTCLLDYTVKRIPVYTFHDGFSYYGSLLKGVLPFSLRKISLYDSDAVIHRFYRACIGWIRYKPLYIRLTRPDEYDEIMRETRGNLEQSLPYVCAYFNNPDFMNLIGELETYAGQSEEHNREFREIQAIWAQIAANGFQ